MKAPKVLVTGANGMLGSRIWSMLFNNKGIELFGTGRTGTGSNFISCEMTETSAFAKLLEDLQPDYVIHSAANVNLESCERDKAYTYKLHVVISRIIASNKRIKKSIIISTDSVFDGIAGNYKEDDYVSPLNYYAVTKALAEEIFLNASHPSVILRTNIFGYNNPLRNSLFEWVWKSLYNKTAISGYNNVFFNPLYVGSLAKIVDQILHREEVTGLLHVGTTEGVSKYDFILKIADLFDYPKSLIQPITSGNDSIIKRPMNTILNTGKIQERFKIAMPSIEEELLDLFQDFKINHIL